jgi:uncharacterized delta-60 repeat protein
VLRRILTTALVATTACLALAPAAGAVTPGETIPGTTTIDRELVTGLRGSISEVVEQPDGKLLASVHDYGAGIIVVRLLASGELDPSFGSGGIVRDLIAPVIDVRSITLDSAGRIVFCGADDDGKLVVGRLTAAGALDSSFGTGGITRFLHPFGTMGTLMRVFVTADGSIVTAGTVVISGDHDFASARLTAAGVLDTTFSTDGMSSSGTTHEEYVRDAVLLADGRLVLVGERAGSDAPNRGSLAVGVAVDGTVGSALFVQGAGTNSEASAIPASFTTAIAAGSSTLRAVEHRPGAYPTIANRMVQLQVTGSNVTLDPSFDGDGIGDDVALAFYPTDMARQSDGRFVVAGWNPTGYAMVVARVLADGETLDTTFGTGGRRTMVSTDPYADHDPRVLVAANGTLVVAGNKRDDVNAPTFRQYLTRVAGMVARTTTTVSASAASGVVGTDLTVSARVAATGPDAPGSVSTRVTIPAQLQVVTAGAGCVAAGGAAWTCTASLSGSSATVTHEFVVRRASVGTGSVEAVTTAVAYDDVLSDDAASTSVTVTKHAMAATLRQLVRVRGRLVTSSCGATARRSCVAPRARVGRPLVAFPMRATVTPATIDVPLRATVQVQRLVRGSWRSAGTGTVAISRSTNLGTWSLPRSLRGSLASLRVRVVVPTAATTSAATSPWRYVLVR